MLLLQESEFNVSRIDVAGCYIMTMTYCIVVIPFHCYVFACMYAL